MSEVAAYAAGLFDGEGSISISWRKTGYALRARISMTEPSALEFLADNLGGKLHTYLGVLKSGKNVTCWEVNGKAAQEFLNLIEPYSYTKKAIIRATIDFPILARGRKGKPFIDRTTAVRRIQELQTRGR